MKSIYLIIAFGIVLGLTSCGGGSNTNSTHVHEDGTVHDHHCTEITKPTEQEMFKVEADSSTTCEESAHEHEHNHEHHHGHDHSHQH